MKFVKLLLNPIDDESRDKREISTALKLNYEVDIICSGNNKSNAELERCHIHVVPLPQFARYKNRLQRHVKMVKHYLRLAAITRKCGADIISCHDIIALGIGYLSTLFLPKKKRPQLVYDSHEFELGRNAKRSKFKRWKVKNLERFLIKRCVGSIMVNDSIAQEVKKIYNLKTTPQVIRNIANYWHIDQETCSQTRELLCADFGFEPDMYMIMYHGGVMENRGIEQFIDVVSMNKNLVGIILGNGDDIYVESLKKRVKEAGVDSRIQFLSAVPYEELWKYVGATDVGIVPFLNTCQSHYYVLPNKLFENIQAMTPIIGSDFPEIKKIVKGYDIGMVCNPENVQELNKCIEIMRTDPNKYEQYKKNLLRAKQELCWEKEQQKLEKFYLNLKRKIR